MSSLKKWAGLTTESTEKFGLPSLPKRDSSFTVPIISSSEPPRVIGYTECWVFSTIFEISAFESDISMLSMAFRGVIIDSTHLSPSVKTRSTMLRSTGWTSPSDSSSSIRDFISRSVTFDFTFFIPKSPSTAELDLTRIQTNGAVATESAVIAPDTSFATFSARQA